MQNIEEQKISESPLVKPLLKILSSGIRLLEKQIIVKRNDSIHDFAQTLKEIGVSADSIKGLKFYGTRIMVALGHSKRRIQGLYRKIDFDNNTSISIGYNLKKEDWFISVRKPGEKFINFGGNQNKTEVLIGGARFVKWKSDEKGEKRMDENYEVRMEEAVGLAKDLLNSKSRVK